MKEPSVAQLKASGYMLADVHILVPLGPVSWEPHMLGPKLGPTGSTLPGVSGLSEGMKSKETMDGVFERLCETMWSLPPQETMGAALG